MSAELRGRLRVMADLMQEAASVISTIDPESDDEGARLAVLLDAMQSAMRAVRMDGVDIDAVHRGGLLDGGV